MKHNPIQTMLDEHDVISSTEKIISQINGLWKHNPDMYKETVSLLITFFREYSDKFHHRKEEDVLFPALKNNPDFVLEEMVDEFNGHHEDFRDSINEIEKALIDKEYEKSYSDLNLYLQDLLDHISAENDELFVLAESLLDEEEMEKIYFLFKDIDRELGEGKKLVLKQTVNSLIGMLSSQ
jgi:hemerythrin-like domain-containing protein